MDVDLYIGMLRGLKAANTEGRSQFQKWFLIIKFGCRSSILSLKVISLLILKNYSL